MRRSIVFVLALTGVLLAGCDKDDPAPAGISILDISTGGASLVDGAVNVDTAAIIRIVFNKAIDPSQFESRVFITDQSGGNLPLNFTYKSATTVAEIQAPLKPETDYILRLAAGVFGQQGEVLSTETIRQFTTVGSGIITGLSPCTIAGQACLRTLSLRDGDNEGLLSYYGSFPIDLENARWEKLTSAVIVVHGQNRDADQYFGSMVSALQNLNIEEEVILISPQFTAPADASGKDLYWNTSDWREGALSDDNTGLSSFSVLDSIMARLGDKDHFPVLEEVIIAGHSSGATFVHTYAVANRSEDLYPGLSVHYVVANNQYFYYPEDLRYDEGAMQFVAPSGCSSFNHWPLGFVNPPQYLSQTSKSLVNENMSGRKILYLLGTADTSTAGTLNTSDCEAVLLGSNRYQRGLHIFQLMEEYFPGHSSIQLDVPGVGHDNVGMFNSAVFKEWLSSVR